MRTLTQRRSELRPVLSSMLFVASVALGEVALAQVPCTGPDLLNTGSCCQFLPANLPAFTNVQLPGLGICWKNCQPTVQNGIIVDWQPPVQIQCSEYVTQMNVTDANFLFPLMTGKLYLSYTRTWDEISPSGQIHQVWRFAAKADLSPVLVGIIPTCPTPSCLPPFGNQPTAFFYGYVDYATNCGSNITQNAVVLYHQCDFFIHRPGLSDRPGVFHPNESYAIVAPHSSAQPFLAGNNPAPSGIFIGEGQREYVNLPGFPCLSTDFIFNGQTNLLGGACLCVPAGAPKHNQFRTFAGQTSCPTPTGVNGSFQALNIGFPNLLPWFNLTTTSIGTWTNNNVYPGKEQAFVDEGLFIQDVACSGNWVSVQYGGTTRNGWSIAHPVLLTGCTDLADNYTAPLFGPYPFPIFGSVYNTDRVTYVFTP